MIGRDLVTLDHQTKLCSNSLSPPFVECFHFPAKLEILAQYPENCLKSARWTHDHLPVMMKSVHSSGILTVEPGGRGDGMISLPDSSSLPLFSPSSSPEPVVTRVRTETWLSRPKNPFKKLSNDSARQNLSLLLSTASLARVEKKVYGVRGARWW